jgi:uncharacterized protein involved in exopolysaccharide biosynthesis
MSQHQEFDRPQAALSVSIVDVMRGIGGRWKLVSVLTLLGIALGLGLVTFIKPSYTTEALVLIESLETPFNRVNDNSEFRVNPVDDRIVQSQTSVLKSHDLGLRVIEALKLDTRSEFNPSPEVMGPVKRALIALGFSDDPRLKTPQQRALSRYLDDLTVYQIPDSNVVGIKYSARSGETAAEIANTLAETYVITTRESQSQPTGRAREWLAQQIEDLRRKVADSEAAVEEFRSGAGLLQGASTTLGAQEISELNTQITVAEAARTEAQAKADSIRKLLAKKGSVDTSSDVLNSQLIQRLREQQVASVRRVAELAATYLPNHPKMIAVQNELTNIDRQIRAETLKIVEGLEEQADTAAAREESLRASLEELKARESAANLDEVKLKALERDAAANRALLESLLNRYADASARQDISAQPGMARIIQAAGIPASPSFPKLGPTVGLTTIAGLALGLGLAFLFEIMSAAQGLSSVPQRAAQALSVAPAAPVQSTLMPAVAPEAEFLRSQPAAPMQAARMTEMHRHEPGGSDVLLPVAVVPGGVSDATAGLAVNSPEMVAAAGRLVSWYQNIQKSSGVKVLGIASLGGSRADATVATVALVRQFSASGKRAIVVDAAANGSCIERLFELPVGPGLVDLVSGSADFTKVIARDAVSGCHLLRWGVDRSPRAQQLAENNLLYVLQAFSGVYDLTVLHCGEASTRSPDMLKKCGAVLILSPSHRKRDAAIAVRSLHSAGVEIVQIARLDQQAMPLAASA